MKKHISLAVILTLILAIASIIISANHNKSIKEQPQPALNTSVATNDEAEMRGLWVSYISLNMNGTDYSEKSFRDKFEDIVNKAKETGCNALFVHVRAFCDAFYESEIYPSSHILWGEQGKEQTYDALSIMCEICEKEKLEIHAWINPYRIMTKAANFTLSENNPYIIDSTLGIEYEGGIYLNPAKKDVRELIIKGVKEILENYKVDGIHFDDYFYPTRDEDFDKAQYNQYLKAFASEKDAMPLSEWRKNNVNMLVADVYRLVKSYDTNIDFGISPQGNIENDLNMGADVKSWCECIGYVDYICPQLYYSLENPALKFEAGLNKWLSFESHQKLKLYAGLAVYKAGTDADEGTWTPYDDILAKELEIIRKKNLDGFILYDFEALNSYEAEAEIENFKNHL